MNSPPRKRKAYNVPEEWQIAAEEVRAHLCHLRGGAPFLSPDDAYLLVGWLEAEVPVTTILRGLERAAEARRAKRSRIPLRLGHAKRHLGRPTAGVFARARPVSGREPRFAPVVRALLAVPRRAPKARDRLEASLLAIDATGDDAVRRALVAARTFFEACWQGLDQEARNEAIAEAEYSLGDLLDEVDPGTAEVLKEEAARDALRRGYPALSAASLWELVDGA